MKDLDYYAECYERYLDSVGDNSLTLTEELQELSRDVKDLRYALAMVRSLALDGCVNAIVSYVDEVLE